MANLKTTGCHFIVPVDVFSRDVLFMFGYSRKKVLQLLKSSDEPNTKEIYRHFRDYKETYRGLCITGSKGQTFITMPVMPQTCEEHGTLVHEIFHGVENIMSYIGNHHPKDEADESWAHLMGYLTAECLKNLSPYY